MKVKPGQMVYEPILEEGVFSFQQPHFMEQGKLVDNLKEQEKGGTTSLYQSHPWVLAILPLGDALGILADTTKRCEIDLRKESTAKLIALSPYPVITFGPFASATNVLTSLSHAIGTAFRT
ncbi:hypothetical protein HanRHA438_Chr11g0495061 [Helianthus annuus]|nr:hypothetical protein HanRHA438_Chr11g0495061 [Helianthus annuus]